MAVWFTSDTHIGDHRTINIGKRPFASVAEMDAAIVANWNASVASQDEVWHLGDVARRPSAVPELLATLNGTKHLIAGNNDPVATRAANGWASVRDYAEIMLEGRKLVLCHYPFRTWNGMGAGAINLHGHSHGRLTPMRRQYDVGVDPRGFRPVSLAELIG